MDNQMRHLLVVTDGPNQGQAYVLQDMVCTIGRTADNTIVIDNPRISRHHTQIRLLPDGAVVEDMGSTNGTWLNGRPLTSPRRLTPGDIIGLADYIAFRFEVEEGLPTVKLTPADMPAGVMPDYDVPPPPPPPAYPEPYPAYPESSLPQATAAPQVAGAARPRRSRWTYVVIAILLILICLCAAVAVYLWFAPVEFWQKVFEFFNIPMPVL
ncbi:MAG TPA: FHA domain-containing protein [Anaerolineae bacterium]|nr:FHA domain-containing protein [Anaerolineae bacterium]HQK15388.1 FHA domain-containing protein [Anaerolineae bacterium]